MWTPSSLMFFKGEFMIFQSDLPSYEKTMLYRVLYDLTRAGPMTRQKAKKAEQFLLYLENATQIRKWGL